MNSTFLQLNAVPLHWPQRSSMKSCTQHSALNGVLYLTPTNSASFPSAPDSWLCGKARHLVQLRLSVADLGWNSRHNYRQISIITSRLNLLLSPQMLLQANSPQGEEMLSFWSPSFFLGTWKGMTLWETPALAVCERADLDHLVCSQPLLPVALVTILLWTWMRTECLSIWGLSEATPSQ